MNGFHTERLVINYLLNGDRCYHPSAIHLQEGDWADILAKGNILDHLDIVWCRVLDHFITKGYDSAIIDRLSDTIGCDIVDAFLSRKEHVHGHKLLSIITDEALYRDKDRWNAMIDAPYIAYMAMDTIEAFYKWWIMNNGCANFLEQRPYDVEVSNDNPSLDRNDFYAAIFPAVSFALSLVGNNNDSQFIQFLSQESPYTVPDLVANDLWLQRRALMGCVNRYGALFIFEHLKCLRYELVAYALLKADFSNHEFERLKEAIVSKKQREVYKMEKSDNVRSFVNQLVNHV